MHPFHGVPPVVAAFLYDVDLFELVLAHVRHEQATGRTVKRETPGIAKSDGIDLRQPAAGGKRIVRRYPVLQARTGGIHVNAHHLAQEGGCALAVAERITAAASIAQPKVAAAV